jgi:hypothetical protein
MAKRTFTRSPVIPKSVTRKAERDMMKMLRSQLASQITTEFEAIKQQMIDEFKSHPVSVEIKNGPLALNTSNTLGGYGNLFSFIGFIYGEDPIQEVVDILNQTAISFSQRGTLTATIRMPSTKIIFKNTPLRWATGRSWAKGIESGISGLGYYIHEYGKGFSEGGFQSESKISDRERSDPRAKGQSKSAPKFKNTPYISSLINKYYAVFSKISGANIRIKI